MSLGAVFWGRATITQFLPEEPALRVRSLFTLCGGPYLAGGLVFVASAALNPGGPQFMFTVALATFGGTAWLAWFLPFMVRPSPGQEVMVIPASTGWRLAGLGAASFTVGVLGPGLFFG